MSLEEILKKALKSKPQDCYTIVDGPLRSLAKPDAEMDAIWGEEEAKRQSDCNPIVPANFPASLDGRRIPEVRDGRHLHVSPLNKLRDAPAFYEMEFSGLGVRFVEEETLKVD